MAEAPALRSVLSADLSSPTAPFTQGLIFLVLTNETRIYRPSGLIIGLSIPTKVSLLKSLVRVNGAGPTTLASAGTSLSTPPPISLQ